MELLDGEGCWIEIDREPDGSIGTMSIVHESRFLFVFDPHEPGYTSGKQIGLIEERTARGWAPRRVFAVNGGLVPTRFQVFYNKASDVLSLTSALISLLFLALATLV